MQAKSPIAILGVPFDNITLAETCSLAAQMIESRYPHYATTVGVDFLIASQVDVELRRILFDAHLILAEENLVVWASKMLGNPLSECVTVPNLIPQLLVLAEQKGWRVFLLGGDEAAAQKIRARQPKLQLVGTFQPEIKPLLEMDNNGILRRIREAKPDILLVAFGCPMQEKWINMNYREAGVPFVLGAGLNFNFLTGEGKAPKKGSIKSWKFITAVLKQWWRLRSKKKTAPPAQADVMPDPHGNLVIRAPARLDAASVQTAQTEWQRAVESGHVMFDLSETTFTDSTGVGILIRLRKRARELNRQFILIAPRPPVENALKLMKLEEFFTVQASLTSARILMESSEGAAPVTSGVTEKELSIRWAGEITTLNAVELGAYTESELAQVSPGMNVVIDLSRVTFVDSTGIGLMVRFKKNLKRNNVSLTFSNVSASVRNVIRATQLEAFLLG
ncbi:MAG TPA: WecB/TagA/CpsF family glycosyltransferase [Verrucomicrobiae bacterium]|nr:WecB/TagA/CpsF family glycosyltransferase [Verrucomicrobiae bacterium]